MTQLRCEVEGCVRGYGEEWNVGPTLCVPHREEWAADHFSEVSPAERTLWVERNTYPAPDGKPYVTWPFNFRKDSGVDMRWAAHLKGHPV